MVIDYSRFILISIIISSYKENFLQKISQNIKDTIGIDYEIIVIENKNKYSIAEAYNLGISKAKFPYLCFVHEDLIIKTENWGETIVSLLMNNQDVGLIGVAGVTQKTKSPSQLWSTDSKNHVIYIEHKINENTELTSSNWEGQKYKEVVMIDGVFMVMRNFKNLFFNTKIPGYHFYDMCISLECYKQNLKVIATNQILIEHYSLGSIDKSWIYPAHIFHKIYRPLLPMSLNSIPNALKEKECLTGYIIFAINNNYFSVSFIHWISFFIKHPFSGFNLLYFKHFYNQLLKNA